MKTKEELNALKKEIEDLNEKCRELTPEELKEVTGGKADKVLPEGETFSLSETYTK